MRTLNTQEISDAVYRMALKAGKTLTEDCRRALTAAAERETGAAKYALDTALENERIARRENLPVCQDTGMAVVFLTLGQDVHLAGMPLQAAVDDGIRRAYRDGSFRKSICDPLTRVNTGDNTPAQLHVELTDGEGVSLTLLPKGFGSENMSRLFMLTPAEGREGILNAIVSAVREAGSRPCPPVYVGVGVGGCFDSCALLAKKALLREVGTLSPRSDVAELEKAALARINALGIGPQGFHGKTTALGVSIETAPTHIAGLPVAVNLQCHCIRCEKEIL